MLVRSLRGSDPRASPKASLLRRWGMRELPPRTFLGSCTFQRSHATNWKRRRRNRRNRKSWLSNHRRFWRLRGKMAKKRRVHSEPLIELLRSQERSLTRVLRGKQPDVRRPRVVIAEEVKTSPQRPSQPCSK